MNNDKRILTTEEAINDIKTLSELIISICTEGKVNPININGDGWDQVCISSQDEKRTNACHLLMNKYSYGWYIAESKTVIQQIKDIKDFMTFILINIDRPVCYTIL